MTTLTQNIVITLTERAGLSDRELTDVIYGQGKPQQPINGECRRLEQTGIIKRHKRNDNIIGNYLTGLEPVPSPQKAAPHASAEAHAEDFVKQRIINWLATAGWKSEVKWGKDRGIDIHARRGTERWVIEVKGIGSRPQMRVNFFLGVLAELLQRMDDPNAAYSVAFPDVAQYRGLWNRLPALAKKRTSITALFVFEDGTVDHVYI